MKRMVFMGKEIFLLTQYEKAEELGISVRTLYSYTRGKKMDREIVILPESNRSYYISARYPEAGI